MHETPIAKRPGVPIGQINDAVSVRALTGSDGISIIVDAVRSGPTPGKALLRKSNNGRQCVTVDAKGHPHLRTFDKEVFGDPWCVLCVNQGDTLYIIWDSKQAKPNPQFYPPSPAPPMRSCAWSRANYPTLGSCCTMNTAPADK